MDVLIVFFLVFGWASLMLKSSGEGFMRKIPMSPEHLRPKNKESVPKMENSPPSPKKNGNCYLNCGNTYPSPGPDVICLNCGSSIKRPEFPKDRIRCNV